MKFTTISTPVVPACSTNSLCVVVNWRPSFRTPDRKATWRKNYLRADLGGPHCGNIVCWGIRNPHESICLVIQVVEAHQPTPSCGLPSRKVTIKIRILLSATIHTLPSQKVGQLSFNPKSPGSQVDRYGVRTASGYAGGLKGVIDHAAFERYITEAKAI